MTCSLPLDPVFQLVLELPTRRPNSGLPHRLTPLFRALAATEPDRPIEEIEDQIWALWGSHEDRLAGEAEGKVAIRVGETPGGEAFEVAGRGELQLGVVIETLRREGFELSISRPRVLFRDGPSGREEPYETVVIDVDDEFSGTVIDKMAMRKAEMTDMRPSGGGKTRLTFSAPSRGLIGYHGEFLSDTRGTGIMNRRFEK